MTARTLIEGDDRPGLRMTPLEFRNGAAWFALEDGRTADLPIWHQSVSEKGEDRAFEINGQGEYWLLEDESPPMVVCRQDKAVLALQIDPKGEILETWIFHIKNQP